MTDDERRLIHLLGELPDERAAAPLLREHGAGLLACAAGHGLRGVLAHHLSSIGVPLAATERALGLVDQSRQQRQQRQLGEALAALQAGGVAVVALKGPLLGARLYPAPDLRPSTDLDLLVRPGDLEPAAAALAARGWTRSDAPRAAWFYRRLHHHVHLDREGSPTIELHHRAASAFGSEIPAGPLIERARPYGGGLVLAPEDEWLYLAVHAAAHRFERLGWLYELKLYAAHDLDWSVIAERARALGVARAVAFTAEVLRVRLRAGIPDDTLPRAAGSTAGWLLQAGAPAPLRLALASFLCDRPTSAARMMGRKALGRMLP